MFNLFHSLFIVWRSMVCLFRLLTRMSRWQYFAKSSCEFQHFFIIDSQIIKLLGKSCFLKFENGIVLRSEILYPTFCSNRICNLPFMKFVNYKYSLPTYLPRLYACITSVVNFELLYNYINYKCSNFYTKWFAIHVIRQVLINTEYFI